MAGIYYGDVPRVFICDGDAMSIPTEDLLTILKALHETFPSLHKVGHLCKPQICPQKNTGRAAPAARGRQKACFGIR